MHKFERQNFNPDNNGLLRLYETVLDKTADKIYECRT